MVQSIDDVSNVLTHITVDIPLSLKQFRSLVDQVGGQNLVDNAVLVSLVELVQTVGDPWYSICFPSAISRSVLIIFTAYSLKFTRCT